MTSLPLLTQVEAAQKWVSGTQKIFMPAVFLDGVKK